MDEFTRYQPGQETRDYDQRLCTTASLTSMAWIALVWRSRKITGPVSMAYARFATSARRADLATSSC
eukprot:5414874-Pleurochrysis_carterae.AAC.1